MRQAIERAASATLLAVGIASLWGALGLFVLAILLGGIVSGFGGGTGEFLFWLRGGVVALACGLAILAARKRLERRRFLALAIAGELGLMVLAVMLPVEGTLRWIPTVIGALGVIGFLATAALVLSGRAASATA